MTRNPNALNAITCVIAMSDSVQNADRSTGSITISGLKSVRLKYQRSL